MKINILEDGIGAVMGTEVRLRDADKTKAIKLLSKLKGKNAKKWIEENK